MYSEIENSMINWRIWNELEWYFFTNILDFFCKLCKLVVMQEKKNMQHQFWLDL